MLVKELNPHKFGNGYFQINGAKFAVKLWTHRESLSSAQPAQKSQKGEIIGEQSDKNYADK